jgi:hypothetical protein
MAKLNITETNMLAVLKQRGAVPKRGVSPGGKYHVALAGLVRAGYATLENPLDNSATYKPTENGLRYLAEAELSAGGIDSRSKMKGLKPAR